MIAPTSRRLPVRRHSFARLSGRGRWARVRAPEYTGRATVEKCTSFGSSLTRSDFIEQLFEYFEQDLIISCVGVSEDFDIRFFKCFWRQIACECWNGGASTFYVTNDSVGRVVVELKFDFMLTVCVKAKIAVDCCAFALGKNLPPSIGIARFPASVVRPCDRHGGDLCLS